MYFRCSNCRADLHVNDSVWINPVGKLAHLPWFRDHRGLNVYATACLHCGTVHATSGAPLKGLLTLGRRMLSVHFHLTPDHIQQFVREQGNPLPPLLTSLLEERAFLGVSDDPYEAEETLDPLEEAIQAAVVKLALYCAEVRHRDFSAASVLAFLEHSSKLEQQGEATPEALAAGTIRDALAAGISAAEIGGRAGEFYYTKGRQPGDNSH